ncbi:MAG: hypothetical protein KGI58_02695 [Patescibacteria group bacterium]|nr:hypothetical protein [Patescibacteria group bacterium]
MNVQTTDLTSLFEAYAHNKKIKTNLSMTEIPHYEEVYVCIIPFAEDISFVKDTKCHYKIEKVGYLYNVWFWPY